MQALEDIHEFETFALALGLSLPRTLGLFIAIPVFHAELVPRMLLLGTAATFTFVVAPTLVPLVGPAHLDALTLVSIVAKEGFVGFVMGCLLAIPIWAFEALGFLIDNQRGASIASTLNPLTGNDSSPLGLIFNQAFIVFFLVSGGLMLLLDTLYGSFSLWPVLSWTPDLRKESIPFFIDQFFGMVRLALLLAAPAMIAMLLAEVGLALVSLAVPQLQVFFLAMPVKSGLVLMVLLIYLYTLFGYGAEQLEDLKLLLPSLQGQWGKG